MMSILTLEPIALLCMHWIIMLLILTILEWTHSKEIENFIDKSTIVTNIFKIQAFDSVMCEYFCIGFINFILEGKSLTEFTNLFSSNNFKKWWYDFKLFCD